MATSEVKSELQLFNTRTLNFTLRVVPGKSTAQHKGMIIRYGKPFFFKNKKQMAESNLLSGLLREHVPDEPFDGPVTLCLDVTWPFRKSEKKRIIALGSVFHTSKPDLDNWVKDFIDTLVRMQFIANDAAICDLHCRKFWGREPGIRVTIEKAKQDA